MRTQYIVHHNKPPTSYCTSEQACWSSEPSRPTAHHIAHLTLSRVFVLLWARSFSVLRAKTLVQLSHPALCDSSLSNLLSDGTQRCRDRHMRCSAPCAGHERVVHAQCNTECARYSPILPSATIYSAETTQYAPPRSAFECCIVIGPKQNHIPARHLLDVMSHTDYARSFETYIRVYL